MSTQVRAGGAPGPRFHHSPERAGESGGITWRNQGLWRARGAAASSSRNCRKDPQGSCEEQGAAARNCHGLTPAPIPQPLHCLAGKAREATWFNWLPTIQMCFNWQHIELVFHKSSFLCLWQSLVSDLPVFISTPKLLHLLPLPCWGGGAERWARSSP